MLMGQLGTFIFAMDHRCLAGWMLIATGVVFGVFGFWDDLVKLRKVRLNAPSAVVDVSARTKFRLEVFFTLALIAPLLMSAGPRFFETGFKGNLHITSDVVDAFGGAFSMKDQCATLSHQAKKLFAPWRATPIATCSGWWRWPLAGFFIFIVVGSANAANLTDGLDGLAAGCGGIASLTLWIGAVCCAIPSWAASLHLPGNVFAAQIAIYLAGVAGANGGFLLFNTYPARMFMGDGGSLALGANLGMAAVLLRLEWLLAFGAGVFVIETLSVIVQVASFRLRNGKRVFLCTPLHHHFECLGWKETRISRAMWTLATLLSAIGLLLLWRGRG